MILALLAGAAAAIASVPPADVHALLLGADHAVEENRLDQAALMISRAQSAGASGPELDRALANLVYARANYMEALKRYEALLKTMPGDAIALEHASIAALKLGQVDRAVILLKTATSQKAATWRVWNACAVAADLKQDWARADQCYERAIGLAPNEVEPVNNRGWSLLLRGDWKKALALFEQAAILDPKSQRTANNLELARAALAADLPARAAGESRASWAARLNDAGVAAALLGDRGRATAAFTQALDVSGTWYARAANNLDSVRGR